MVSMAESMVDLQMFSLWYKAVPRTHCALAPNIMRTRCPPDTNKKHKHTENARWMVNAQEKNLLLPGVSVLNKGDYVSRQLSASAGTPHWDTQTHLQKIRRHYDTCSLHWRTPHYSLAWGIATIFPVVWMHTHRHMQASKASNHSLTPIWRQALKR